MRVVVGGYLVAANTFATQRMGLESFQRALMSGDAVLALARGNNPIAGFMAAAQQSNWDVVPLHFVFPGLVGKPTADAHAWTKAFTEPSGLTGGIIRYQPIKTSAAVWRSFMPSI